MFRQSVYNNTARQGVAMVLDTTTARRFFCQIHFRCRSGLRKHEGLDARIAAKWFEKNNVAEVEHEDFRKRHMLHGKK